MYNEASSAYPGRERVCTTRRILPTQGCEEYTPLCASCLLHRGFSGVSPCAIRSFIHSFPGERNNSAQRTITSVTLLRTIRRTLASRTLIFSTQSPGPSHPLLSSARINRGDTAGMRGVPGRAGCTPWWVYQEGTREGVPGPPLLSLLVYTGFSTFLLSCSPVLIRCLSTL